MIRISFLIVALLTTLVSAIAQSYVSGTVIDRADGQSLPGAQAALTPVAGGKSIGVGTDIDGKFRVKVEDGKWTVKIAYVGYVPFEKVIEVNGEDINLGTIKLKNENKKLDEVKVTGVMVRQEQKGDTTVFNADAFKVNPDATTEDLIKKMPGMQVEGGQVKNGGETVKKVLVDGKEFFGDDPMTALRTISADMVSKIEVYDKQSDQAEFTGFSDGNDERTINILTKMGIKSGRFGRVYAGYGTNDRYELGGNMNYFRGEHRISLIGMLNNINQQNFSFEDMSSMMSNGGGGRGMMMGGGMMGGGGGWSSNGGKNRTGSIGLNYSLDKEDKIKIEFSYSHDNRKNISETTSEEEYFARQGVDTTHFEFSSSNGESKSMNNRATLRLNWTINENNSIILTPRFTWQSSESNSASFNDTKYAKTIEEALADDKSWQKRIQDSDGESSGVSGSGNVMWRHKFSLPRRTLTVRGGFSISMNNSDNTSRMTNQYADKSNKFNMKTSNLSDNETKNNSFNGTIMYTEPFGDNMALQINYSPSVRINNSDRQVKADTVAVDNLSSFNNYKFSPSLSNKKESTYTQHRAGLGWNIFKGKTFNATFGVDLQKAILKTDQEYPYELETSTSYTSVLPSVRISLQNGMQMHGRVDYRTSTSAPSIDQLQEVVDVSNLMSYSTGNKDLSQQYSHNLNIFMARNNAETSRGIFVMAGLNFATDYITSEVTQSETEERFIKALVRGENGLEEREIVIPINTSLRRPINMDGYINGRLHLTLTTPITFIKSTGNLSLGANFSKSPSKYNNEEVTTKNISYNFGSTLASNISENVDFTISYNGAYSMQSSTRQNSVDVNVYSHTLGADVTCLWFTRLVFSNHISHQYSSGRGKDYDDNYLLWNASLGVKFFQDRRAELRLKVNDLLDNTKSVSKTVGANSTTVTNTDVLRQYAMLTFTYKFKTIGEKQVDPFAQMMNGGKGNRGGGRPPMMMGPAPR
ncbi:MAG: outer membrane beta-barrel protein [Bacteroidales bacterium]|nr:outer membrane beta-barrel protein [Bacteroidales bacterium]